ncbi:Clp protease N-terminal domain-containing protein [Micromonospora cremea]|uniref:Clp amino terminal domain-containing protein, pathogenicity island component n=1 Tax=Micromonospora cremea TaxID=709881 RepID=A0A1N6A9P9_9ACTN|nr:Clp protease N-terminal domain-containing protein [Micromonospora cremea]SIN30724.1 Clp amino terminal domain-containing protein, pathogenicity island component [Micromonospora cremea]
MPPHEAQRAFVALGAMPMRVLLQAYSAAVRRGASSVGTLDMLCRVALYPKSVPPWLLAGSSGANLKRMVADPHRIPAGRTVSELVSESVSEFDQEVQAILREVEWRIHRQPDRRLRKSDVQGTRPRPPWTSGVRTTLAGALHAARDNCIPFANLSHLVLGMLQLRGCDGTHYVFPYEYARLSAIDRLRIEPTMRRTDQPYPDLDDERLAIWPGSGPLFDRLAGRFFARASRLSRLGPTLIGVDLEARRQAIRLGQDVIGPLHILLAMLTHDATLEAARVRAPAHHSSRNRGSAVLRTHGVDADRLRVLAAWRAGPEEPPAEVLTKQLSSQRPGDPFTGTHVVTAMARAMEISLAYRHPDTGTSHLLLALIEDDAGDCGAILRELSVDPKALRARVEQDLRAAPAAW